MIVARAQVAMVLASIGLAAAAAPADAAAVRVRWSHPHARDFVVYVKQSGPAGTAGATWTEHVRNGLAADATEAFAADLPLTDAFAGVEVRVTALAGDGRESEPSNVLRVTPAELCGVRDCDGGVACTEDLCDAAGRCIHVGDGGRCPDGELCTDDVCDPRLGCTWVANSRDCSDGRACTVLDLCFAGERAGAVDCPSGAECDGGTGFCRRALFPASTTTTTTLPEGVATASGKPARAVTTVTWSGRQDARAAATVRSWAVRIRTIRARSRRPTHCWPCARPSVWAPASPASATSTGRAG